MTDINIPRHLPTTVSREKVNSTRAGSNDDARPQSWSERNAEPDEHTKEEEPRSPATDEPQPGELEEAVARLNDYVQNIQRDIFFDINPGSTEPLVSVVDRESRQLVRQFQGDEALELAKQIDLQEPLCLFKTQV